MVTKHIVHRELSIKGFPSLQYFFIITEKNIFKNDLKK